MLSQASFTEEINSPLEVHTASSVLVFTEDCLDICTDASQFDLVLPSLLISRCFVYSSLFILIFSFLAVCS